MGIFRRQKRDCFIIGVDVGLDKSIDFETKGVHFWLSCLVENEPQLRIKELIDIATEKGVYKNFELLIDKGYIYEENGKLFIY